MVKKFSNRLNSFNYCSSIFGPMIALVPFAEKMKGKFAEVLKVFGKVPMFYYLLHIPLIHLLALIVNLITNGVPRQELYDYAPYVSAKTEERWSLSLLYLVSYSLSPCFTLRANGI